MGKRFTFCSEYKSILSAYAGFKHSIDEESIKDFLLLRKYIILKYKKATRFLMLKME